MNRREFIKGVFATGVVAGVVSGVVGRDKIPSQVDEIAGSYEDYELPEFLKFLKRGIAYSMSKSNPYRENGVVGGIGGWKEPFVDSQGRRYIAVPPIGWDTVCGTGTDHEVKRLVELPGRVRRVYLETPVATSKDAAQLLFQVGKYLSERNCAV